MQIIDFEKKGNVVRFLLGEKTPDWGWTRQDYLEDGKRPDWLKPSDYYGDDWNDYPYESNAGSVYPWFVKGYRDLSFAFDDLVLEPCDGFSMDRHGWSKDDMKSKRIPCIIVVPKSAQNKGSYDYGFMDWVGALSAQRFYFGDELAPEHTPDDPDWPYVR